MNLRNFNNILPLYVGITSALALASCSVTGEPVPQVDQPYSPAPTTAIRQTDDQGKKLPFSTKFPDRWSDNNDGTSYEPCTAVAGSTLRQFDLDPTSASDVAVANHQTARGCNWKFANDRANSISQFVGNGPSLDEYRTRNADFEFLPDVQIEGRQVLRYRIFGDDQCAATIQSGKSQVLTIAYLYRNTPPREQLCDTAVNFLRATIEKIPK